MSAIDPRTGELRLAQVRATFDALVRAVSEVGTPADDRDALPRALAAAVRAQWTGFRAPRGEWMTGEVAARRIDFGCIDRLPRGRLVRLAGPVLERAPRWAGSAIREILVYRDPHPAPVPGLAVMALAEPLGVEPGQVEAFVRAWMALASLRTRIHRTAEEERHLDRGTRAACAVHDLRHELTLSSLELDRIAAQPDPLPAARLAAIRTALARARALCEGELELNDPATSVPAPLAALLREEALVAQSVAGRRGAVRVELRVAEDLAFPVDRRMLSRIVRNLALNAIQNSPDGGVVSVEAALVSREELVLRVVDRGRGMSASDREELLRFGRSGRGGWGIGSESIRSCARRIGATINLESRVGLGTRVEVRVPSGARPAAV